MKSITSTSAELQNTGNQTKQHETPRTRKPRTAQVDYKAWRSTVGVGKLESGGGRVRMGRWRWRWKWNLGWEYRS